MRVKIIIQGCCSNITACQQEMEISGWLCGRTTSVGGFAVKQTWHFSHDLWADVVRERKGMFVQTQDLMALIGLRSRGRRRIVQIIERLEACDEHENEARNKS